MECEEEETERSLLLQRIAKSRSQDVAETNDNDKVARSVSFHMDANQLAIAEDIVDNLQTQDEHQLLQQQRDESIDGAVGDSRLVVDVHADPDEHRVRPFKHSMGRFQRCCSEVTPTRKRSKITLTSACHNKVHAAEANLDVIETVTDLAKTNGDETEMNDDMESSINEATMLTHNEEGNLQNDLSYGNAFLKYCSESAAALVHRLRMQVPSFAFDMISTASIDDDLERNKPVMPGLFSDEYEPVFRLDENDDLPENIADNFGGRNAHLALLNATVKLNYDDEDEEDAATNKKGYQALASDSPWTVRKASGLSQSSSLHSMPACRICQLPAQEPNHPLISPCRCLGSIRYVHNACLLKWLEVSSKRHSGPPSCELCQYQYLRQKRFVISHWRFPSCSWRDAFLHLCFLICILVMVACAAIAIICFEHFRWSVALRRRESLNTSSLVSISPPEWISLSCALLFFSAFFMALYVEVRASNTLFQLVNQFLFLNHEWSVLEYDRRRDVTLASSRPRGEPG